MNGADKDACLFVRRHAKRLHNNAYAPAGSHGRWSKHRTVSPIPIVPPMVIWHNRVLGDDSLGVKRRTG